MRSYKFVRISHPVKYTNCREIIPVLPIRPNCLGPPKAKGPLKCFSYMRCALSVDTWTFITTRLHVRVECVSCVSSLLQMKILCIWSWLPHEHEVSLSQRMHALYISGYKDLHSVKTQICCFSNFTCKYRQNHFFVQINIFERESFLCSLNESGFSHYFIFIRLSDNRNNKIFKWK